MNSREAAFLALLYSVKGERFIHDSLEEWRRNTDTSSQDYHLARQIAYGSVQMALALDYFALQVSTRNKIQLKVKERALFRTAIYQMAFLDRIPRYAVVDETMKIAKKYFHKFFLNFLNASLRKLSESNFDLPKGLDAASLSMRYSYPQEYVAELLHAYGLQEIQKILELGNEPAITMARVRETNQMETVAQEDVSKIGQSTDYYIQNATPVHLIQTLAQTLEKSPERVLDVCAAPGGKTIAVHDLFSEATYYANDVSPHKIDRLNENFNKYKMRVHLSCSEGQFLQFEEKFDLIILDVPCSNTGVLNKRPEARWRLSEEHYSQLEQIQYELMQNAIKLLNEGGKIWYMTCSILPRENEKMVDRFCKELGLKRCKELCILPNSEGWDGGYACSLKFL